MAPNRGFVCPERHRLLAGESPIVFDHANQRSPVKLRGLLLVHLLRDEYFPIAPAREFHETLLARGIEHEYVEQAGVHGQTWDNELLMEFLAKHLVYE